MINKDLRKLNPRRSDEQDVVITSSGIPLSQILVSKVHLFFKKSVHHDVVGILVTSESSWSIHKFKKHSRVLYIF